MSPTSEALEQLRARLIEEYAETLRPLGLSRRPREAGFRDGVDAGIKGVLALLGKAGAA